MLELAFYLSVLENEEDLDKLTLVYTQYLSSMYKTAQQFTYSHGNEDDIVHEAMLKVIDNLEKIDLNNNIATKCYVCTIVKNKARDWLRKEKRSSVCDIDEVEVVLDDTSELPLETILRREGYEQLIGYINDLSDTYRDACRLKFVSGLTEKDIAKTLDISPKNVSVRIARGRKILIQKIKESRHD